jgi:positive regulator of sigma E activity
MKKRSVKEPIKHDGIVEEVGINSVVVRISSASACSGCHAENLCNISGKEDKLISVEGRFDVAKGDPITVLMQQSMGMKAVLLGYILPLFIMITSLVILVSISFSELTAGLVSIGILIPYFLILYLVRNKIDRSFIFALKV